MPAVVFFSSNLFPIELTLFPFSNILNDQEVRAGFGARTLTYHFPEERALITTQYQVDCAEQGRKRIEQESSEVRQTSLKLISEGTNPSS